MLERARVIFVTGGSGNHMTFLNEHRTLMKPFTGKELVATIQQVAEANFAA